MTTFDVVTAAWSFALALWVIWAFFRCRHHWELVDKTEMGSRLEEIRKHAPGSVLWSSEFKYLSYRRLVLAMRCSKCGAAKIHKIDSA